MQSGMMVKICCRHEQPFKCLLHDGGVDVSAMGYESEVQLFKRARGLPKRDQELPFTAVVHHLWL